MKAEYIGADVVQEIVTTNRQRYTSDVRSFVRLDVTRDALPAVDLILYRDCLFHFSFDDIARRSRTSSAAVRSGCRPPPTRNWIATATSRPPSGAA